jgi:pentatricopeptide repeat protein
MSTLDLGVIGNCQISALIDGRGRVVWSCLPRLDGDPVFCSLLDGNTEPQKGFFDVELEDFSHAEQSYLTNTPILETILHDTHGGAVKIVDFAPRFEQFDRIFRPTAIARYVEPLSGNPRVRIRLRPAADYGAGVPDRTFGSNHIRYVGPEITLRLTTDASISHVLDEYAFVLDRPLTFLLGPDESLRDSVVRTVRQFFEKTRDYWQRWVRTLSIPFEWQDAVIRAAITLKLCTFEDTGALVAAMTTSIPEAANTVRNWDYRYCWLRDSFFMVHALNRLGATITMEAYLRYILDVAAATEGGRLQPVYGIRGEARLTERMVDSLSGYRNMGPVRVGNQAYEQVQHDVYGSVILSATQIFFDRRLSTTGGSEQFQLLELLGGRALELHDQEDAGIWEYRGRARVHTYSSLMCWAGCDRLGRIARQLGQGQRSRHWFDGAKKIRARILKDGWNAELGYFVDSFGGRHIDASMLLVNDLGFLPALWYINALAALGRVDEARELFENMLTSRSALGLLSEDLNTETGEQWGNFPQTYSMAGIINVALRLSQPWERAF